MVPPKKPEWFELTDGEERPRPNRRKKIFKIAALSAPLVIVAAGVVVAQTGESGSADAVTETSAVTQTVDPTPEPTTASTPAAAPTKASIFVKKPAIANPPTRRGGDDDGFGEHEGREHRGGDYGGEWEDD